MLLQELAALRGGEGGMGKSPIGLVHGPSCLPRAASWPNGQRGRFRIFHSIGTISAKLDRIRRVASPGPKVPMSDRFFAENLAVGARVELTGDEGRHLASVMRARVDDEVTLFDGSGAEFTGRIAEIRKGLV